LCNIKISVQIVEQQFEVKTFGLNILVALKSSIYFRRHFMEPVQYDEDNLYPKESKIILKIIREQFDLLSDALDSVNSAFTFKVLKIIPRYSSRNFLYCKFYISDNHLLDKLSSSEPHKWLFNLAPNQG
jgi:hypothetical protein